MSNVGNWGHPSVKMILTHVRGFPTDDNFKRLKIFECSFFVDERFNTLYIGIKRF